ncbi:MAG: metallophosphoesterase [Clostridia bacterium]|jgi:predicted phosphohydrolase|nr:metallophosphoesterase [Clostridia bacterium]
MAIYVIADLHLSFSQDKPMSIFGENWEGHSEKIKNNWISKVKPEDTVVLPGDFSWAMYLQDTYKDFEYLNSLPGKKLLLKGNHDYWWTTVTNMRNFLEENKFKNIDFIYNNSYLVENKILTGTRGWNLLDTENSSKMIKRESIRLQLAIEDGIKKYGDDKEIIVFMHYPPISNTNKKSDFLKILKQYDIKRCYYGHLHGKSHQDAVEGIVDGIEFKLISADYLNFDVIKVT